MTTPEQIKVLCVRMNISISELARRTGYSPQNFGAKRKHRTITDKEVVKIASDNQNRLNGFRENIPQRGAHIC